MKTAFEQALEISYYAEGLKKIAENPTVAAGRIVEDDREILVLKYGEPKEGRNLSSSGVSEALVEKFEMIAQGGIEDLNELTKGRLLGSLATLQMIANSPDPAPGYVTHFSNLQQPLLRVLPRIKAVVGALNLERAQ